MRNPVTTRLRARARAMRLVLLVIVGTMVLSACEFSVYKLPLPGGTDVGENAIEITVVFADVLDLVPQSTVKVNDVNVGRVTDVSLNGEVAEVTVLLRNDVELPDNAKALIRQTSLLGEKFVSLEPPADNPSPNELVDGDVIPLDRSGANPDVEEVFAALSLLLNGGGVAQLRTIAKELNKALEGREDETKSALNQIDAFVSQLDANKGTIVAALEDINRLSVAVRNQQPSIDNALDELPSALLSLDRQTDDLTKMLTALNNLSDVGVRVIRDSKESTIEALRQLQPTLTQLADSGDAFVDAFNVFLTYPFVDEVVGRDPQVARSLRMGDFTNLSVELEIDLTDLPTVGIPCTALEDVASNIPLEDILDIGNLCDGANAAIQTCVDNPSPANCQGLPTGVLNAVCDSLPAPLPAGCGVIPRNNGNKSSGPKVPNLPNLPNLPGLPNLAGTLGLNRVAFDGSATKPSLSVGSNRTTMTIGELMDIYDPALTSLLVSPLVTQ